MTSVQKQATDLRIQAAVTNDPRKLRKIFKRLNKLGDWVSAALVAERIRYLRKGGDAQK
jgi:hypothetical protein